MNLPCTLFLKFVLKIGVGKKLVFLGFMVDISGFSQSDTNGDIPFLLLFGTFTSVIHWMTGSVQGGELFLQLN